MKPLLKKILRPLLAISLSLSAAAVITTAVVASKEQPVEAVASKSNYWSSWASSHGSETGSTFAENLHDKIATNTTYGYDKLWAAYASTDVVPGYENDSDSSKKIWDMYGGYQYAYQSGGKSSYGSAGAGYNREHSIPNSWWSGTKDVRYSDLICLLPTDGYVNNTRSNYMFGEVSSYDSGKSYTLPVRYAKDGTTVVQIGNQTTGLGSGKTINNVSFPQTKAFEPADQYKGDFARIYMYFAIRYYGDAQSTTEGQKTFSTSYPYVTDYTKAMLQKWHIQDPVSSKETARNDAVETKQGNRNPFVDYPEWADKIFGTTYQADVIDGGSSSSDPSASITASPSTSVQVGSTITLTAALSNVTSANNITWTSSNNNVTVTKGATTTTQSVATVTATAAASNVTISCKNSGTAIGTINVTFTSSSGGGGDSSDEGITSSISAGDQVVLVSKDALKEMTSYSSTSTIYGVGTSYSTTPAASMVFTVEAGSSSGTYSFKNGSNYMYWNSGNSLQSYSSKVAKSSWSVSFDSSGNATIKNASDTSRQILWNVSATRFATYSGQTIGTNYYNVQLYKLSGGSTPVTPTVTGVTVSPDTLSLDLNGTVSSTLSATVKGTNVTQSVTWSSSNSTVAEVSTNGVVTAKAEGSATIYATANDDGTTKGSCAVTVTDSSTPVPSSGETLNVVYSELGLSDQESLPTSSLYNKNSQTLTITYSKGTGTIAPRYHTSGSSGRFYYGSTFTITSSKANIKSITLTFASGDGSNTITASTGTYSNGSWTGDLTKSVTFTIGGTSGHRRISAIGVSYYDAEDFADYFNSNIGCDASGSKKPTGTWSNFSSKFSILFTEDQNTLKGSSVDQGGTDIQKAMYTYDYIIAKYGINQYANFINRTVKTLPLSVSIFSGINSDNSTAIIVIASLIGLTSALGLVMLRKRKEN